MALGAADALLLRLLPCLFGLVALGCHFFCIEQDRLLFVRALLWAFREHRRAYACVGQAFE